MARNREGQLTLRYLRKVIKEDDYLPTIIAEMEIGRDYHIYITPKTLFRALIEECLKKDEIVYEKVNRGGRVSLKLDPYQRCEEERPSYFYTKARGSYN